MPKLKTWKPKYSLQLRILLLTILIATLVLGISDRLSNLTSVRALENEIGAQTTMVAHRLAGDLRHADMDNITNRFHRSLLKILELVPNITRADVYAKFDNDLKMVVSSALPNERVLEDFELTALNSGKSDTYMIEDEGGKRRIVAVMPLHLLDGRPGLVTVISSLKPVDDLASVHSRIQIYMLTATILSLGLAITLLFRTTVYRSIDHLAKVMHRFQNGETAVRAHERLPGEFSEVARHLNQMLEEISQFHEHMKQQIQEATDTLARRNQELESLNLLLYETQKRLVQAERLALIGQLTATFAHEVGSPLSAVSTHLQILLEDPQTKGSIQERLRLVDAEINRVCGIVENLLTNARRPDYRIPVDVRDVIRKVTHLLGPTLQARQVDFSLEGESGPALVSGNPDQLQQLFLNLFNNSLDAMPGPGRIQILIRRTEQGPQAGEAAFEIQVKDSGVGISADKLEHIFEPFFTTKEFGKGTGLGLAFCREIINRHGGQISVASPPGQSAVFTILLPEIRAAAQISAGTFIQEAGTT